MEDLMILFWIVVYIALAVLFVFVIRKLTKRKFFWWLAVVFVILLPTWDVVLGYLVYLPACHYIPKVAIYYTAETDGIYYEGKNDTYMLYERESKKETEEELTVVVDVTIPLSKNFHYIESKVIKKYNEKRKMINVAPIIYKCIALPQYKDRPGFFRTSCSVNKEPQSKYMVKVSTFKIGIAEINFKKIIDRSSGKLMAEYKRVSLWSCFPFFEWLEWRWWSKTERSTHCPLPDDRYSSFEYEVLKPLIQ